MEIRDMSLSEIETRFAEIRSLVESETDMNVEALELLTKETDELEERKAQLNKVAEERAVLIEQAKTSTQVVEQQEERKVTLKMEDRIKTLEYRNEWLSAMKSFGEENRSVNAAAVVGALPQMTINRVIEKLRTIAPLLNEISLFAVQSGTKLPVEGTSNVAALHTENGLISGSADTVVEVLLGGYEINKLIRLSRKALTMSIDAFEDFIVDNLAKYVGRLVSHYLIKGTGSSQPQGVEYAQTWSDGSNAVQFDAATPTATELIELVGYLPGGYAPGAKWLMNHKTFWSKAMAIRDDQKFPLVQQDGAGYRLLGFPVVIDDQVDDGDFFFGDFKQLYGNFAQQIEVIKSEHSGLPYNAVDYLGGCIFDSKVALAEAFIKGAASL